MDCAVRGGARVADRAEPHVTPRCAVCGDSAVFTNSALAIVVGGADLIEPVNLSPNDDLRCCTGGKCDSYFVLVSKSLLGLLREADAVALGAVGFQGRIPRRAEHRRQTGSGSPRVKLVPVGSR